MQSTYKKKSVQLNNHFRVTFYGDAFTNDFSHLTIQNTISSYIINAEKPDDWESSIVNIEQIYEKPISEIYSNLDEFKSFVGSLISDFNRYGISRDGYPYRCGCDWDCNCLPSTGSYHYLLELLNNFQNLIIKRIETRY